jgi:hypothetical protein
MMSAVPASTRSANSTRLFLWGAVALLAVAQLVAFWRLCETQITKAQVRDGMLHSQRLAIRDCLQNLPGASLSGCVREVAAALGVDPDLGLVPAVPVSFVLR